MNNYDEMMCDFSEDFFSTNFDNFSEEDWNDMARCAEEDAAYAASLHRK